MIPIKSGEDLVATNTIDRILLYSVKGCYTMKTVHLRTGLTVEEKSSSRLSEVKSGENWRIKLPLAVLKQNWRGGWHSLNHGGLS